MWFRIVLSTLMAGWFFLGGACSSLSAQLEGIAVQPDVIYGHKDGMALTYDVFTPTKNPKNIGLLFMVSGGWVSQWAPPEQTVGLFRPLLERGFTVMAVRHGSSPRYVIPEVAGDIRLALKHISSHASDYHVDPKRLGVFGGSAGGHLSLLLGTTTNQGKTATTIGDAPYVAAVVALYPPTDLAPYVDPKSPLREQFPALKFDPNKAPDYSPLSQVTADDAPSLLIHGDKDELVPLWHSEKIRDAFTAVHVDNQLVVIEGAAHGFDAEGTKLMYDKMIAWFEKHLQP